MIVARAPYRLSLGGGGTDLPWYAERYSGYILATALDLYVHVGVRRIPVVAAGPADDDRLTRAARRLSSVDDDVRIFAVGDVPPGSGLGSSGSYLVALLYACRTEAGVATEPSVLAELARQAEYDATGLPAGAQDPYVAAFGGFRVLDVAPDGGVAVHVPSISAATVAELEERLLLAYTGLVRGSTAVLAAQRDAAGRDGSLETESLHRTKELGYLITGALEDGDLDAFGRLLDAHWRAKLARVSVTNPAVESWYGLARANGALGGKLVGAGGGFLLLDCPPGRRAGVCNVLAGAGLTMLPVRFAASGAHIICGAPSPRRPRPIPAL